MGANSLFQLITSVIKGKLTPLWTKWIEWRNPARIRSALTTGLRHFFEKLFDVKPKDQKDYYKVFSWMVGKKLAYCLVLLMCIASLLVLSWFHPFGTGGAGGGTVRAYRYDALLLRFHKGMVRILASDGHTAYVGEVEGGGAKGAGRLYGKEGNLIYEGGFERSRYEGEGKLYYGDGSLKYAGTFRDNLYQGTGTSYWSNGSVEYTGGYENGLKSGDGQLHNAGGDLIFTGMFHSGQIVYEQLVGKSAKELGEIYTGRAQIYTYGGETCVDLPEIGALYVVSDGVDSLEEDWRAGRVYVLKNSFLQAGKVYTDIRDVAAVMGKPGYEGFTNITLAEAVGIRHLREKGDMSFPDPRIESRQMFKEVTEVSGYLRDYDLYLYAFEQDGLLYSFYCDKQSDRFAMYSVEEAE